MTEFLVRKGQEKDRKQDSKNLTIFRTHTLKSLWETVSGGPVASHSPLITNKGNLCPKLEIRRKKHLAIEKLVWNDIT